MSKVRFVALVVVLCLVLAACGSDDAPGSNATATAEATPTATPMSLTIGEINWTSAVDRDTGEPLDTLNSLPNDADHVVAAIHAESLPPGTVIEAVWTIDGDPLPELTPEPITIASGREDAWIAWTLTWEDDQPWPVGRLGLSIDVNGEPWVADEIHIVRASG